ncbi:MAG: AmmeMemoRadiSam system protein B [Epsilonproteobacteria bacterium]|nr:AmmeMemoRadiSam system protein B [Campylobacterota bacterium]
MRIRESAVAGQFYPASKEEIRQMIDYFNKLLDENIKDKEIFKIRPRSIIAPHAGYIYSGFTANFAHRLLGNRDAKTIVVIGPSHRVYLSGTSVSDYDFYETPFGNLKIDREVVEDLKEKFSLSFYPEAHHEHSTEVQMPFIKFYNPDALVVELVYGDESPLNIAKIIEYLLKDPKIAVVISTDLSHYYDIEKANMLDSICLKAVNELDPSQLHRGCEACGKIGVEGMIIAAKDLRLKPILLDYRTSADASGDTSQVVGYMSAAFVE